MTLRPSFLAACIALLTAGSASAQGDDPLLRPIAPDYAARWLGHEDPVRVHGRTYLVGFSGLSVALIDTGAGLVLVDGAVPQGVREIEANLKTLGFKLSDVRFILSTEPHYDHAGGLAALARDTGAVVVASPAAAVVLRKGESGSDDPQHGLVAGFPPVTRLRTLKDGETLKLGRTVFTAHATPGHTAGSVSWSWRDCEKTDCRTVVFAASLNPVSADDYRFSAPGHAGIVGDFRRSFAKVRALPCDILLSAHPEPSGQDKRLAAWRRAPSPNPFVDPAACRAYADSYAAKLDARLASEKTAAK
jgi:metallo-beta-lactamase class B